MDNSEIKEYRKLLDVFDLLNDEPLNFRKLQQQLEILGFIHEDVEDPKTLPDAITERLVEATYQGLTNIVKVWPFEEPEGAKQFVDGAMDWDPETREVLKDHLSELKHKQPDLYHPSWDQILIF